MSLIVIKEVQCRSKKLNFKSPLELIPYLDEENNQLLCVENDELNINAFAITREELIDEVKDQICMLWENYAQASDDVLTSQALELKKRLIESIEEVEGDVEV